MYPSPTTDDHDTTSGDHDNYRDHSTSPPPNPSSGSELLLLGFTPFNFLLFPSCCNSLSPPKAYKLNGGLSFVKNFPSTREHALRDPCFCCRRVGPTSVSAPHTCFPMDARAPRAPCSSDRAPASRPARQLCVPCASCAAQHLIQDSGCCPEPHKGAAPPFEPHP